eukprot:3244444-Amphidinium_carterae.3
MLPWEACGMRNVPTLLSKLVTFVCNVRCGQAVENLEHIVHHWQGPLPALEQTKTCMSLACRLRLIRLLSTCASTGFSKLAGACACPSEPALVLHQHADTVWTDGFGRRNSNLHFRICRVGYVTESDCRCLVAGSQSSVQSFWPHV